MIGGLLAGLFWDVVAGAVMGVIGAAGIITFDIIVECLTPNNIKEVAQEAAPNVNLLKIAISEISRRDDINHVTLKMTDDNHITYDVSVQAKHTEGIYSGQKIYI